MKSKQVIIFYRRWFILIVAVSSLMFANSLEINGQEAPPRPPATIPTGIPENPPRPITVSVNPTQNMNFGAFYVNTGGSVIIYPDGSRVATGDVVLISAGYIFSAGLFDITGYPGTPVSILNGPDATLTCACGGTLTLRIRNTDMNHPFIITTVPPTPSTLSLGGTLIVGNQIANPPGSYSGTYNVIFVQE